jgi:hypothetical protein
MDPQQIAEAFSSHRFADVYDQLASDVRWVSPGQPAISGKDAVVAACAKATADLEQLAGHEFTRFVSVGSPSVAAVDAIARYVDPDGSVSIVSSADIYEFNGQGSLTTITSYAVEIEA